MNEDNLELKDRLLNSLNEQGFLFQEACANALRLHSLDWELSASEYPVRFEQQDTRIDIVLHSRHAPERFAIVECKRSNPVYECWLFAANKSEYRYSPDCQVLSIGSNSVLSSSPVEIYSVAKTTSFDVPTNVARSWLEVKARANARGSSPQNIENAFAQALRGVSGLAAEQIVQPHKARQPFLSYFIPVVVTTASLYAAHYDPQNVNMSTGTVEQTNVLFGAGEPPEELPWILVHYGATKSVASSLVPDGFYDNDPKQLLKHKLRSIFIVNSNNLIPFFNKLGSV